VDTAFWICVDIDHADHDNICVNPKTSMTRPSTIVVFAMQCFAMIPMTQGVQIEKFVVQIDQTMTHNVFFQSWASWLCLPQKWLKVFHSEGYISQLPC